MSVAVVDIPPVVIAGDHTVATGEVAPRAASVAHVDGEPVVDDDTLRPDFKGAPAKGARKGSGKMEDDLLAPERAGRGARKGTGKMEDDLIAPEGGRGVRGARAGTGAMYDDLILPDPRASQRGARAGTGKMYDDLLAPEGDRGPQQRRLNWMRGDGRMGDDPLEPDWATQNPEYRSARRGFCGLGDDVMAPYRGLAIDGPYVPDLPDLRSAQAGRCDLRTALDLARGKYNDYLFRPAEESLDDARDTLPIR